MIINSIFYVVRNSIGGNTRYFTAGGCSSFCEIADGLHL